MNFTIYEDEECGRCGAKEVAHMGHGSFICQKCFEGLWCKKCGFSLRANHICIPKRKSLSLKAIIDGLAICESAGMKELAVILDDIDFLDVKVVGVRGCEDNILSPQERQEFLKLGWYLSDDGRWEARQ